MEHFMHLLASASRGSLNRGRVCGRGWGARTRAGERFGWVWSVGSAG
jgi:hypothetical protein